MRPLQRPLSGGEEEALLLRDDLEAAPRPSRSGLEDPVPARPDPSSLTRARLIRFLEKQTGQRFGDDLKRMAPVDRGAALRPASRLRPFKAAVYGKVDPRFAEFFPPGVKATSGSTRWTGVAWGQRHPCA